MAEARVSASAARQIQQSAGGVMMLED